MFNGDGSASAISLNPGVYQVSGAFSGTSAFNVQNQDGDAKRFSLSGSLPMGDRFGPFNFTLGKFSKSGNLLPPRGGLLDRSTIATNIGDLRFNNFVAPGTSTLEAPLSVTPTGDTAFSDDFNFGSGGFTYEIRGNDLIPSLQVNSTRISPTNPAQRLRVEIDFAPSISAQADRNVFSVGRTFDLSPGTLTAGIRPRVLIDYAGLKYASTSGTATIKKVGPENVTIELSNVTVATNETPSSSFTVNGTFEATGLRSSIFPRVIFPR